MAKVDEQDDAFEARLEHRLWERLELKVADEVRRHVSVQVAPRLKEELTLELSRLRELLHESLSQLGLRVEQVVEGMKEVNKIGARTMDAEQACSRHISASRQVWAEMATQHEQLREMVTEVESRVPRVNQESQNGDGQSLAAMRDQLLKLSMRVADMGVATDPQVLQSLSDECREELRGTVQVVKKLEEALDNTNTRGRAALESLGNRHSRLERKVSDVQQTIQSELNNLIEELKRNQVPLDMGNSRGKTGRRPYSGGQSTNTREESATLRGHIDALSVPAVSFPTQWSGSSGTPGNPSSDHMPLDRRRWGPGQAPLERRPNTGAWSPTNSHRSAGTETERGYGPGHGPGHGYHQGMPGAPQSATSSTVSVAAQNDACLPM